MRIKHLVEELEDWMMDNGWLIQEEPDVGDIITAHDTALPETREYEAHVTRVSYITEKIEVYYYECKTDTRTLKQYNVDYPLEPYQIKNANL